MEFDRIARTLAIAFSFAFAFNLARTSRHQPIRIGTSFRSAGSRRNCVLPHPHFARDFIRIFPSYFCAFQKLEHFPSRKVLHSFSESSIDESPQNGFQEFRIAGTQSSGNEAVFIREGALEHGTSPGRDSRSVPQTDFLLRKSQAEFGCSVRANIILPLAFLMLAHAGPSRKFCVRWPNVRKLESLSVYL